MNETVHLTINFNMPSKAVKWRRFMKKILALFLSLILVVGTVTACGSSAKESTATTATTASTADTAVKTGLGVVLSIAKSTNATDAAKGLAEVDATAAAVLVGADGKILACNIDGSQAKINFDTTGQLTTATGTTFKSKQELKTEYGLGAKSAIKKEWNEQADAFAKYCVGKTLAEVKGIAVSDKGVATVADLTSSCTIGVTDFVSAIDKAVTNAQNLGAKSTEKLGIAVTNDMGKSANVSATAAGLAQGYSFYSAVTTDTTGKITSCVIDASQGNINFDAKGTITTDLTKAPQPKQELKEAYGMKAKSGLGKEWYEEANSFAKYATGKTASDIKGIAVTADGKATIADVTSSVTISVAPLMTVVSNAVAAAK